MLPCLVQAVLFKLTDNQTSQEMPEHHTACFACVWTRARGGLASRCESASRVRVYFG